MTLAPPTVLEPQQADFEEQVAALPHSPGIYCLFVAGGNPHMAWSANLQKRLKRLLLASPEQHGNIAAVLRQRLTRVECRPTGSKLEASLVMYGLAKELFPADYIRRLRMRMPWFIAITARDNFGRLAVVNRSRRDRELVFGPFASRDVAEYYEQAVLTLFQIRRCTERLAPSPEHPGCIYGEMNQCLRPCQSAVSIPEYDSELERVSGFFQTNGATAVAALSGARAAASENMDFEQAAHIHKRIEQVKAAIAARDEVVTEIGEFNGLAINRAGRSGCISLWPMQGGYWQEPILLDVSAEQANPKSLDVELRERLTDALSTAAFEGNQLEHLAIFSKWYRSTWRDGAWVGFRTVASLNYRKLVREISKLVRETSPVSTT